MGRRAGGADGGGTEWAEALPVARAVEGSDKAGIAQCTLMMTLRTAHIAQCTLMMTLRTAHIAQCTLMMTLRTAHIAQCTLMMTLRTAHIAQCTPDICARVH